MIDSTLRELPPAQNLKFSRQTAASYLNRLVEDNFLEKTKKGRTNYYTNKPLFNLLQNVNLSDDNKIIEKP